MCAEPIPLAGKGEERAEGDSVGSRQLVHETNARPSAARTRAKNGQSPLAGVDPAHGSAAMPLCIGLRNRRTGLVAASEDARLTGQDDARTKPPRAELARFCGARSSALVGLLSATAD